MSVFFIDSSLNKDEQENVLKDYVPTEHLELAHKFIYFETDSVDTILVVGSNGFTHKELILIGMSTMSIRGIVACGTVCDKKVVCWGSSGLRCFIRTPKVFRDLISQKLGIF